uniref:Secreted protein n=1 Tax=Mesocestoides corti TaxID=53468 RepID=A0A5K3FS56_MESCO
MFIRNCGSCHYYSCYLLTLTAAPAPGGLFGAGGYVKRNRIATAFHKCAAAEKEVTQTTDTVVRLAQLQDFGGFWNMDKELSELLNLTTGR